MNNSQDHLMHYGRLGMKWGVMNGPPYPLGQSKVKRLREQNKKLKERQKVQDLKNKQLELKKSLKLEKQRERLLKKELKTDPGHLKEYNSRLNKRKGLINMTDKEISDTKNRLENENKIREAEKSSIANGKSFVKAVLLAGGTVALTTFVKNVAEKKGASWADSYVVNGGPIKRTGKKLASANNWIVNLFNTNP